jgi:putative hydrolase
VSDSIFDKLFELFQSSGPVNWQLGNEVMKSIVGEPDLIEPRVSEEYLDLAGAAELKIQGTGLLTHVTSDLLQPVDRRTWAELNERSFEWFILPLAERMSAMAEGPMAAMMGPLGPALAGMQSGTMVGFMSHRVLGQFDTGLPALGQRNAVLVIPAIEAFAEEYDLDAREVRFWASLRAVAYRSLLAKPGVEELIRAIVVEFLESVEFDMSRLTDAAASAGGAMDLEGLLSGDAGIGQLLGATYDTTMLKKVQGLLATIEGFVDVVINDAAQDMLPSLSRIVDAHTLRRSEPGQADDGIGAMIGLRFDRGLAADAGRLVRELVDNWGVESLDQLWSSAASVPTADELTDPVGWVARNYLPDIDLD